MKQGFWNGKPVKYEVCKVMILDSTDFQMPWTAPFVGEHRQAVRVFSNGDEFCLDNEDGSGLNKLYNGGMMTDFHRTISSYVVWKHLPEECWNTELIPGKYEEIEKITDAYWEKNNPEAYERIQKLRESVKQFRSCTPSELANLIKTTPRTQKEEKEETMKNYSYGTVVQIDKSTLPKDGQRVRFEIYNYDDLIGTFIEEEDMFLMDGGGFHYIHEIFSWEPIQKQEANS